VPVSKLGSGYAAEPGEFVIRCERAMFGVDYPHFESIYPETEGQAALLAREPSITHADLRRILFENAAEVYGLDLGALRPAIGRAALTRPAAWRAGRARPAPAAAPCQRGDARRAGTAISRTPPIRKAMPPASRPAAIQGSAGSVAATLTWRLTGREPSAFMAT